MSDQRVTPTPEQAAKLLRHHQDQAAEARAEVAHYRDMLTESEVWLKEHEDAIKALLDGTYVMPSAPPPPPPRPVDVVDAKLVASAAEVLG